MFFFFVFDISNHAFSARFNRCAASHRAGTLVRGSAGSPILLVQKLLQFSRNFSSEILAVHTYTRQSGRFCDAKFRERAHDLLCRGVTSVTHHRRSNNERFHDLISGASTTGNMMAATSSDRLFSVTLSAMSDTHATRTTYFVNISKMVLETWSLSLGM